MKAEYCFEDKTERTWPRAAEADKHENHATDLCKDVETKTLLMRPELSRHEFGLSAAGFQILLSFCCLWLRSNVVSDWLFFWHYSRLWQNKTLPSGAFKTQTPTWMYKLCICVFQPSMSDERRGSRPRSMVRSFTMPSSQRPLSVASVTSISSDNSPSRPGSDGYTHTHTSDLPNVVLWVLDLVLEITYAN